MLAQKIKKYFSSFRKDQNFSQEENPYLQQILDNSTAVVYMKDLKGRYLFVNSQFEKIFQIRRDKIIGKTDYDFNKREMADWFRENDLKVLKEKKSLEFEEVAEQEDGLHTYISIKFPLYKKKKIYATCGISTDITERKQAEKALQEARGNLEKRVEERTAELKKSYELLKQEIEERERAQEVLGITEKQLTLVLEQMPAVLWTMDRNLKFTLSLGSSLSSLGLKPNQVVGMNLFDFFKSTDENHPQVALHLKALQGEAITYENEWQGQWFHSYLGPWRDKEGNIIGTIGVGMNITDRKIFEEQLKRANEELKTLSRLKSDFTSMVSHELRTPLSSIKEAISLILDEIEGPLTDRQKKTLQIAKGNTDRLARLIFNVLDYTMIESGKMKMFFAETNLNELVQEVCELMQPIASKKEIQIFYDSSLQDIFGFCDEDKMKQVLINLIDNAIKYTSVNKKIEINLSSHSDQIEIDIKDFGIGIKEEDQARIFSIFEKGSHQDFLNKGGFGIGLAVCKYVVNQHQGRIELLSEYGKGSQFKIIFPSHMHQSKEVS